MENKMELESTFETAKRLNLGELKPGNIVEIIYKNEKSNQKSVFGKLLSIEFMTPDITWVNYVVRKDNAGNDCTMGTNLLYVEKIRLVSDGEILNRLNGNMHSCNIKII